MRLAQGGIPMRSVYGVAAIRRRSFALFCVLVLTLAWLSLPVRAAAPDPADIVEIFARDVYFINGSTLRNPDETTDPSKPLFNTAGVNLNVTWGEWQNAQATSTVQV